MDDMDIDHKQDLIDLEVGFEGYDAEPKQSVLICLYFPQGKLSHEASCNALLELEEIIREIVELEEVGEVDGHEFAEGEDGDSITYYMYGDDANKLYDVISPILSFIPYSEGSYVIKQFDELDELEERIDL